ncbi:MAG: GNAT family N-acetyltransferase [Steroidobacteraceae bacterium]
MLFRRLELTDLPAVAQLARGLAAHVKDPDPGLEVDDLLKATLEPSPWCECLVAVEDEAVVAFALYCRRYEAHTRQRTLWLGDLITAPDTRGRGVGHALIEALRGRARELDCIGITLEVWRENEAAIAFYDALGARRCERSRSG